MKKSKKMIACLLIVSMFISNIFCGELSPFVMTAHAAWDGTVAEGFSSGDGTKENPYIIEDESEFAYFGNLLSEGMDFSGNYLELNNDIDMTGNTWSGSTGTFNGELCGNGHTVSLDTILFKKIGTGGKLTLLSIKREVSREYEIVCTYNYGTIEGCSIIGTVSGTEVYYHGLVCQYNSGSFINSYVRGTASGYNSYIAGVTAYNSGVIDNVYSSVTNGITQGGKYAGSAYNPLVLSNSGTITNAYYVYGTSTNATAITATNMKTQDFVDTLNKNNPSLISVWTMDTDEVNDGFPILIQDSKSSIECYLAYSNESIFTYHTKELKTQILTTENVTCEIYYTLDGSDPTTSETAQLYDDGQELSLSGDVVLSYVACENGKYGKVTTQDIVCILGEGTEESPYEIENQKDLSVVYLEPAAYYRVVADIRFTSDDYSTSGLCPSGWQSISEFSGVLDGEGHEINYLKGTQGGFVNENTGSITNVRFTNCQLTYEGTTGTFGTVANYNSGKITKCYVNIQHAKGIGMKCVGGIVGNNHGGTVAYCQTDGGLQVVTPNESYHWIYVGGIAGCDGTVSNCYNNADISVTGNYSEDYVYAGGIAGYNGYAKDCRNDGEISVNIRLSYYLYVAATTPATARYCYGDLVYTTLEVNTVKENPSSSISVYSPSELNNAEKYNEETYVDFDFEETWMITADGPMPQGIMNADGNCYTKTSYVAPTCTAEGTLEYKNQSEENFSETIPATGHVAGTSICQGLEVCAICDALIPNEEYPDISEHDYAATWSSDETYHWKECQSDGCSSIGEKAEHCGGTATPLAQAICSVCGTPYGELDETIETFEVSVSTYNIDSLKTVDVTVSGDGIYIADDTVTVSTSKKLGMKFIGWYEATEDHTYTGDALCKEYTYSFEITANLSLVAVYQTLGTGRLRVYGSGFKVNNGVTQSIYNYAQSFTIGENVTLTATGDNFAYWLNESNKIVTTNKTYSFIIAGDVTLTAVYANAAEDTAYVEFVSDYGQVIEAQNYSSTCEIQIPGAVNKVGCKFLSWSMTAEEIALAISEGATYIRVTPVYEALPGFFTITTIYDGDEANAEVVEGYEGYQFKEFVAKEIDGRTFSHWSDSEKGETILSTSETYSIYINKNMTVYAIYVDEGTEVTKVSTMVTNDISAKLLDDTTKSLVVLVTRDMIDGYTLIEHGILYSANSAYGEEGAEDTMIVGASGVSKGVSTSTAANGSYAHTITLTEAQLDIEVYARGYMILADSEGKQTTIYGVILHGSYNSLNQ